MSNAEARKMSPEEMSGPESERKMRQVESGAEKAEGKKESAGDRFLSDSGEYAVLNAKADAKRMEIKNMQKEILPPGKSHDAGKAALEGELKTLYGAMDKISNNYGDDAWSFRFDAMNLGDLNAKIEQKKSRIREISAVDPKDWAGGEKGQDMILEALQNQVGRLGGEATRLEQKLKENYDKTEGDRQADLKSVTDAEIDALLSPMDEAAQEAHDRFLVSDAGMDKTEAAFMAKGDEMSAEHIKQTEIMKAIEAGKTMDVEEDWLEADEAELLATKNELSPDRQAVLRKEVESLKSELFDLKSGLAEAEDELRKYGVNPDTLSEAKDSESMINAFKQETSFFARIKKGVKFLVSPGYRKALDAYNMKSESISEKSDEIARTELAITDPMKAADLATRRVLRNIVRNATNHAPSKPKGILSM